MMQGKIKPTYDDGKKAKEIDDLFARNKETDSDDETMDIFSQGTKINKKVKVVSDKGDIDEQYTDTEDEVLEVFDGTNPV